MKHLILAIALVLICGCASAQTVVNTQSPISDFQINGVPAVGGKLFVYQAGTTTKTNTYTDSSGSTPNTNPIIFNSRGEPENGSGASVGIWIPPNTSYKLVFSPSTDSDPPTNPIWSVDNLVAGLSLNIGTMVSGTNYLTYGTNPVQDGSYVWNSALTRSGASLTGATNIGNNSADEFLNVLEANESATLTPTGVTNGSTSTSSSVLHFASVPGGVAVGMEITDITNSGAIVGRTVLSIGVGSVTMSGNASQTVNTSDTINFGFGYFKGPLYTGSLCSDVTYANIVRSCNAITGYSHIANGNTSGYAEGIVMTADSQGTGDGLNIAGEFDIGPINSTNSAHCDTGGTSDCHTNLWLGNSGTQIGSWVLDTGSSGPGWNNGISLRNIASGGTAVQVPNSTFISGTTTGGAAEPIAEIDSSNAVQFVAGGQNSVFNGSVGFSSTKGLIGKTDGSAAASGQVGETNSNTQGSPVSLSNNTPANILTVSVPTGQWLACGQVQFLPAAGTTMSALSGGISTVTAALPAGNYGASFSFGLTFTAGVSQSIPAGCVSLNFGSATNVYLVAQAAFGVSTMTASGSLNFLRVR